VLFEVVAGLALGLITLTVVTGVIWGFVARRPGPSLVLFLGGASYYWVRALTSPLGSRAWSHYFNIAVLFGMPWWLLFAAGYDSRLSAVPGVVINAGILTAVSMKARRARMFAPEEECESVA
jgi:hypothetical protein